MWSVGFWLYLGEPKHAILLKTKEEEEDDDDDSDAEMIDEINAIIDTEATGIAIFELRIVRDRRPRTTDESIKFG